MTPDERGQRIKEIKERLQTNYDVTPFDIGEISYGFENARDDVVFLLAEMEHVAKIVRRLYAVKDDFESDCMQLPSVEDAIEDLAEATSAFYPER